MTDTKAPPGETDDDEIRTRMSPGHGSASSGLNLMVLSGGSKGTTRPRGGRVAIGKAPDNDLVL